MKDNFIHVCFIIDESGSMTGSESDVIGGFKRVVDEQKANTNGTCSISYFKFADKVDEVYIGKDINDVSYIDETYKPGGCTALFDAVGVAIDKIGKWLDGMAEEDKPEKNLIVIMTDGSENSSREYTGAQVKDMIAHQESKYSWTFIYMGSDLTNAADANTLGVNTRYFASKTNYIENYDVINCAVSSYRNSDLSYDAKVLALSKTLNESSIEATENYAKERGLNSADLLSNSN